MIISRISDAIGSTPLLHIPMNAGRSDLYIKLEHLNPCGSMKDRMARSMLDDLLMNHTLPPDALIVESSSGNTAGALAMLCAEKGMTFRAIVDHHAARDKIRTIEAYGASVEYVDDAGGGLSTAIRDRRAAEISTTQNNCFWTEQHNNPANAAGYVGLANELFEEMEGKIDVFISAIGTGGSLCGTSRALKKRIPSLYTIGVEPEGSIIFGGEGAAYYQSGTGTPDGAEVGLVIDYDEIDEGRKVGDTEAFAMCRVLARRFGLLVGGSTGGAIFEAAKLAHNSSNRSRIVTLACDSGSKYLDTIFDRRWLEDRALHSPEIEREIESWFPRPAMASDLRAA
jgi:cystathionine beta-synthase